MAQRGCPHELISDQGTNFRGGERELREAYAQLAPMLQEKLAQQQIKFSFNPPHAPHFGGTWEREVRFIKSALRVNLGTQVVTEEVLYTVFVKVDGIMNSKPLGYVSSNISDADPITPNILLMGRRDASLPQVLFADSDSDETQSDPCRQVLGQLHQGLSPKPSVPFEVKNGWSLHLTFCRCHGD